MSFTLKRFICMSFLMLVVALPLSAKELVQRVFNDKDGLAKAVINDIAFSENGFVWLGTEQGLYRVSNTKIRRIDRVGSNTQLSDSFIKFIENAGPEHLLVSTPTRLYLYNINANSFLQLGLTETTRSLEEQAAVAAIPYQDNNLMLLTHSGRVFQFDYNEKSLSLLVDIKLSAQNNWQYMTRLDNERIVFATTGHIELWNKQDGLTITLPWKDTFGAIRQLFADSQSRLWILSSKGLYQFDPQSMTITLVPNLAYYMERMLEDDQGQFWLASRKGLILWRPDSDIIKLFEEELKRQANIDYIHDLAMDEHGLIWVGGSGDGLAVVTQDVAFMKDNYSKASKYQLASEMIWAIYSQDEKTWLGSDGGITVIDHLKEKATNIVPNGIELNDSIYRLVELDDRHLLLGSTSGLFVINKLTDKTKTFSQWSSGHESLAGKVVISLERDLIKPERIWMGTNRGLFFWQPGLTDPKLYPLSQDDGLGPFIIYSTLRDSQGRLWISGNKVFGYVDDKNQFISKKALFNQDSSSEIVNFMEVEPGIVWFASIQHGVLEYNAEFDSLASLNDRWSLDCSAALSMAQTQSDNWVVCDATLLKINKATKKLDVYDHKDGFVTDEFNEGSIFYREDKGLFLGSPSGAMIIAPELLEHRLANPEVFLESVSVYHESSTDLYLNPEELKQVQPGSSLISFQLTTSDYLDDSPLTFQYRLLKEGQSVSTPFLQLDGQSQINIAGLSAGKYTLEIKHRTKGMWETSPNPFFFEVLQHWWQIPIFKWLAVLLGFSFALVALWYRQIQLHRFKAINQALVDSDDRLRQALRGSDSDLWEWRSSNQMIYLENQAGMLGDRSSLLCPLADLPIHENDKARVGGEWNALLNDRGEVFESEYRYYRDDKTWGWLRVRGRAVEYDPITGAIERVAGIYSDITVQKELESEITLLAQAFEHTTEGMLILDANEKVLISNLAANLILATKPNALVGDLLTDRMLNHNGGLSIDDLLGRNTSWTGEKELQRSDNSVCPAWMNISMMQSNKGLTTHYVVIFSDISERKQNEVNLRYLANNDVLTGLANRAMFTRRLTQIIAVAQLHGEKLALLFLDLDRFKHVNDSFGHSMGDALLIEAARRLQSCLTDEHLICRFGGDEFVILLRSADDLDMINHVAEQLLKQIERPFKLQGREFFISTSIGISVWPDDSLQPETLIKNADLAMYHAKEEGRGNFQYYSAERNEEALYHLKLEADLRKALELGEFSLHYQPQVDILHQDKVVGMEALIRWHHPEEGNIRPDIFIKVAESCGLIIEIDNWVFRQACIDGARWHTEFNQAYKLSVNVSAVSFSQADFIDELKNILADTGMPANLLTVEITEGVLMKELHMARAHLIKLKALGIKVSIDDFGTGYSSLAYLRHFEVNCLKIDRSFLIDIGVNKADQAIVSSIVELARNLKLEVVAEGIETHEQLEQVFSRGCYLIQGYYFAKPMPRVELEQFLGLELLRLE